jgi:hypothetical protein
MLYCEVKAVKSKLLQYADKREWGMFGKDTDKMTDDSSAPQIAPSTAPTADPAAGFTPAPAPMSSPADTPVATPAYPADTSSSDFSMPVTTPLTTSTVQMVNEEKTLPEPAFNPAPAPMSGAPLATDDLVQIKQEALQQLSPLVGHLDQSPEEKFHTTMMMLQATDDQTLVKTAYEAAQSISDEKARAQALLDVVNEINYFTQHQK